MRVIIFLILLIILSVPIVNAESQDLHGLGAKGYSLVLDTQFEEANKIFDEIIKKEPDNALGYFLKALSYEYEITVNDGDKKFEEKYIKMSLNAVDIAKDMLDKNKDDADAQFYLGYIYGNLGLYYGATGRYLKAWWYGRKAMPSIEVLIEKDPEYYDAYLGVGLFEYLLDVLPKRDKVLSLLIGDHAGDREKGIDHMVLASQKGSYTRDRAKFFLADWVYFNFEDNDEAALELFEELAVKYPNNLFFKMRIAKCYLNLYKYDLAIQTINDTLKNESLNKFPNIQTLLCRYLGLTYSEMNEYEKAVQVFQNALTLLKSQKRSESWEYQGALYYIGDCYEMMGETDKAHEYYSKVSKEDKSGAYSSAQARINNPLTPARKNLIRGRYYSRYQKYSFAEPIFNDLIASEQKNNPVNNTFLAEVYFNLGTLKYHQKEYKSSIQTFEKVLTLDDVKSDWIKPWSHCFLGHCYKDKGEIQKAKQEYNIAYKYEGAGVRNAVDKARREMELKNES